MRLVLLFLSPVAIAGAGWLLARALGFFAPAVITILGGLVVLGAAVWGTIAYQRAGDGPGCSVCVVSPRAGVAMVAAIAALVGLLVCVIGAAAWGTAALGARRASRPDTAGEQGRTSG